MPSKPPSHERRLKRQRRTLTEKKYNRHGRDPRVKKIHGSKRWRKLSELVRRDKILCEDPFGEHKEERQVVVAEQSHHIVPVEKAPELAFERTNIMSLCKACHAKIEGEEDECKE